MFTVLVEYENHLQAVEYENINEAIFFARLYAHCFPRVWKVGVVESELWDEILFEDGVCVDL